MIKTVSSTDKTVTFQKRDFARTVPLQTKKYLAGLAFVLTLCHVTSGLADNSKVKVNKSAKNKAVAAAATSSKDSTTLGAVEVKASALVEDDPKAYNVTHNSIGTKTDTPLMETPMAIQVIPQQVLKDQQDVRVEKALQNVSGVYSVARDSSQQSGAVIRGFQTDDYYRNGTRVNAAWLTDGFREMANIERIEVLKGPASILYGRVEPGGMINVVTKKPQATPYYSLQQQFGSYNFYRTTADATGAITKDKSLLYRLNFAYENAGSFREFINNDRVFFAPVLQWNISEKTKATLELEYKHSNDMFDQGLPAVGNRPAQVPINRNLGEAGGLKQTTDSVWVGLDWSHAFNDKWSVRHKFNTFLTNSPLNAGVRVNGFANTCNSVSCPMDRAVQSSHWQGQQYYTSLDLTGKIDTWLIKHTLLFGFDYFNTSGNSGLLLNATAPSIDLYNPVHTGVPASLLNNPDWMESFSIAEDWYGFYFQDQAKLPYNISLLAGFRYDNASVKTNDIFISNGSPTSVSIGSQQANAIKPRFGIVWQAIPELSFYGNYVENFGLASTFARSSTGGPLPPQTAEQWEIGSKTELFNKRLMASIAWFDITKHNVATPNPDPSLAGRGFAVNTGAVRNKGLELDLSGEVYPGLNVIGNYAYTDSVITQDNSGNQGNRFFNVPKHGGSVWTTYELQRGKMRGLKFGIGTVVRGQREGDNAKSFQMAGYATVNLMTSYTWHLAKSRITTQLNVDNMLDKRYYGSSQNSNSTGIFPGTPLTFLGSVKFEY